MLEVLRLDGYRSFGRYRLSDLTRVNLLVGRNNSGKTSLLEAVELLVSCGDPRVLLRSAERRGETARGRDPDARTPYWRTKVAHLFHGHDLGSGTGIRLDGEPRRRAITLQIRPLTDEEGNGEAARSLFDEGEETAPALALEIRGPSRERPVVLPVGRDGSVGYRSLRATGALAGAADRLPRTRFLTPRSLDPGSMRTMWDAVQIEGREAEVVRAVRLVVPDLESIHFLSSDPSRSRLGAAGVLVGLGDGRRVPLGSQGDGMRRILALSLSLIDSTGGFLLIDEIEAGLHWTVMRDMWRFVVRAARESSVQVFATTHSLDCVRGLASLLDHDPDLGSEVSAHKLDRRLESAVALDADSIRTAVEQEIELR